MDGLSGKQASRCVVEAVFVSIPDGLVPEIGASRSGAATGKSRRAFTMVEMMVVIVIVGILSGLAFPLFGRITAFSRLDGDANALYNDIQWTRINAVKSGGGMRIAFADTIVSGRSTKNWKIYQLVRTSGVPAVYQPTLVRSGVLYTTSQVALPPSIPAPTSAVSTVFSGLSDVSGGFQGASGALSVCTDGSSETWADGIMFCGETISDVETGAVYLSTSSSDARAYAIVFNRDKSLSPLRFRYMGGWGRI
jgi:prepilin-type N-terminal cleavage/methylation domain-containing protein